MRTHAYVIEGLGGAAIIVADLLTPFMRDARSRWGLDEADAARRGRQTVGFRELGVAARSLSLGPTLIEPIGFAIDRRMLLGIKERVERVRPRQPSS